MGADTPPSAGEARKLTQTGHLPLGSVEEILKKAPEDLKEETIDIPEWGCSVQIKSFTAAQSAAIKERGFGFKGEETTVAWAEMEITQFQMGVIEPRFSEDQVRELHLSSGVGFQRVIEELDKLSRLDKEALRKAREEFPGAGEPEKVSVPPGGNAEEEQS
jgi:hypothetical protein